MGGGCSRQHRSGVARAGVGDSRVDGRYRRFGRFKKLHYFQNVALAVSKTDKIEVGKVYDATAG